MYRYYVHDKTRKSWHFIELQYEANIGETVFVNYGSEEKPDVCKCEIVREMGSSKRCR